MDPPPTIHAADYAIFIIMIVVTLGIGLFNGLHGRKQKTLEEYFTGNRKLRLVPVILSMVASLYSSVIIVGFPAEVYTRGGSYWLYAVGITVGAIMAAGVFVPVFHPLKLTSMNHYLWERFDSRFVVVIGTILQVSISLLHTSIAFFGASATLAAVTPIPIWASIVVGAIITIIYTTIGGIKGVVWTDVLQSLMMMASLLAVCIQSIRKVGGFTEVWDIAEKWDRLDFLNFDPDPKVRFTFWSLIIGVGFHNFNRYGNSQITVQRYCSLPTLPKAILSVLGLIPVMVVVVSLASISGLGVFAFYTKKGCDPLKVKGEVKNVNQLIPYFVMDQLNYPGIPGVLLAGLIAASLSTASSYINSAAANTWVDILQPRWPKLPESRTIIINKLLVAAYGFIAMGLAFVVKSVGGTIIQFIITFSSATGGPTTALYLLGVFCPFVNWIGAAAGVLGGCVFGLWVGFGGYTIKKQLDILNSTTATCNFTMTAPAPANASMSTPIATITSAPPPSALYNLYSISYLWLSMFALLVGLAIGITVSLITMIVIEKKRKVEGRLLHPIVRYILKIPNKVKVEPEKSHMENDTAVTKM